MSEAVSPFEEVSPFDVIPEGEPAEPVVNLTHVKDLVAEYRELKKEIAAQEERLAYVRGMLEKEMGRAETGLVGSKVAITWKTRVSQRFDSARLKSEQPELYASYMKSASARYFIVK
jgi:predicted phage-related endonuclease